MKHLLEVTFATALLAFGTQSTHADTVTDWNTRSGELMAEAKLGTPAAVRVSAIVQTAVRDALDSLDRKGDAGGGTAAVDAAVAAASRATLERLMPAQQPSITAAYEAAIASIPDSPNRSAGIRAGEAAAAAVLAARSDDGASAAEQYRPVTTPGAYIPTSSVATPQWPQRKPWLLARADQVRPAGPPPLGSAQWARDLNEVKALGSRTSTSRSPQQSEIARFWEYSLPPIYYAVVRSVATQPGRDALQNARLFAAVAQGMDDALIAVMDAKYHYNFWRPVTAIRNADIDGNDATQRDPAWSSFVEAPLHPEYPSAHAILAGVVGTVIQAESGARPLPPLSSTSPTAKGATRRWNGTEEFMREVAEARIYEGIHYRFSTEAGLAMGRQIGRIAAERLIANTH